LFSLAFVFGSFPSQANSTLLSSSSLTLFGLVHVIGWQIIEFIADIVVSSVGSRFAHWLGGNLLIILSAIGVIVGIIITSIASDETKWLYLIAGAALGTMESGFLIQIFIIFGRDYGNRLTPVNTSSISHFKLTYIQYSDFFPQYLLRLCSSSLW
jgi:hypothetical protein